MEYQVAGKCFVEQKTGLLIGEVGGKVQAKAMVMCWMTPFVITEEGDMNHFTGGKKENIYQADEQYFNFLEGQVRKLKAENRVH